MPNRKSRRQPKPIAVGRAELGLSKLGIARFDFSDPYHLAVSLSWPGFAVAMLACWLAINLVFAFLYDLSPGAIANVSVGSFAGAFFFSIETLATVGYGVMAPDSLYGHVVSAVEIVAGMAFTAIFTGLLFVRFSRPKAKIVAARDAVVTLHNGRPTLMLRIINGRVTVMSGATARLFVLLVEHSAEGALFRRIHDLPLQQSHLPLFVMPWTLMHVIDEASPLHGYDAEALMVADARLFLTIEARDHALSTQVHDIKDFSAGHIRFGLHFSDMVILDTAGRATADLTRIHLLEPDSDAETALNFSQ
ncbi:MAG TPA: ion channel [Rhodopila sp.]|jgi:inward rectifier potassium channel|nr:ion channel [Rhodopila sp.]